MKNSLRSLVVSISLVLASVVAAAGVPTLEVMISAADGKVAFKGKTNANGSFATGNLAPGDYVVQFNSKGAAMKGKKYALVISAGKQKMVAESVAGEKFGGGGVAMRLNVGKGLNITGQVSDARAGVASPGQVPKNVKIKIVDGKKYIWITPTTGSHLGGHWAEEGSAEAQAVLQYGTEGLRNLQERGH